MRSGKWWFAIVACRRAEAIVKWMSLLAVAMRQEMRACHRRRRSMAWLWWLLFACSSTAYSDSAIPPSCEQYLRAVEACVANAVNYYELTDIPMAEDARTIQKMVREARVQLQHAVTTQGQTEIARRCTRPAFVGDMANLLTGLILPLASARALDDACASASNEILMPQ